MANINSKTEARQKVREAQAKANEARQERERQNVDDAASFLVEMGRLAAVDEWEQCRVAQIRAEGERRRHEHRRACAAAVKRMLDRRETLTAIAELAGVKVSEGRAILKSAGARPGAPPGTLGAGGATPSAEAGPSPVAGGAARPTAVGRNKQRQVTHPTAKRNEVRTPP